MLCSHYSLFFLYEKEGLKKNKKREFLIFLLGKLFLLLTTFYPLIFMEKNLTLKKIFNFFFIF